MTNENTMRKFTWQFGFIGKPVVDIPIGNLETLFIMEDGRRIVYDEVDDIITTYERIDKDVNELSETDMRKEFSRKLKRAMRVRGYSQAKLGLKVGTNTMTINRFVNEKSLPTIYMACRLESVLGFPHGYFTDFSYLLSGV